jgi:hypothetical protein
VLGIRILPITEVRDTPNVHLRGTVLYIYEEQYIYKIQYIYEVQYTYKIYLYLQGTAAPMRYIYEIRVQLHVRGTPARYRITGT